MESLPLDISLKLERLPVISVNDEENIQKILISDDFNDIYTYYENHFMPDDWKSQQEIYKRLSLYLTITNQDNDLTSQLDSLLYRRPVPTISEFLSDKFYMYNSNATLYPYWRQQLEYMFREGSPIRKTIFGGSIGCLTGDTIVATLNGNKTIYELLNNYDNEWVLSFNTSNKTWEPDKIINVFCSGIKDVYKITLDNNEVVKCTSDHKFLTRKNKWKSIDTGLKSNESMMPYYSKISDKGYIQIKNNITEKWEKRYQIVGKWKTLYKTGQVVHHKNFNKLDDRPQNLAIIPHKYHWEYHAKVGGRRWKEYNASIRGDEFKEYRRQKGIKSHITYKARLDYEEIEAKRKIGWNKLHQDPEHQRKASLAGWNGPHGEEYRQKASKALTERNKTEKARNISKKMAENMRNLKANKSPEEKAIILAKQVLATIARFHGKENQKYIELLAFIHTKEPWYDPTLGAKENYKRKKIYNHKIISIEYIGKQQVYDITTEKNHNFALNAGIIAHNCGKSTIARKAFLYVLYRILCLRYPRAVFNIDSDATIANIIISMTLKQVYETNLLPFIKLMETMPCFQKVMNMRSFENFDLSNPKCPIPFTVERSTGTIYFPDNIIIGCGSGITHTIGLNIVNSFCDEINEKGVQEALALLNSVDGRFSSRFQGSPLVFQSVVSSARTVNSPIGEYIKRLPKNDPSILVLNPRLWEVKEDPEFLGDGTTFPILVGNGSIPSKIFTDPGELKALEDGNYEPPAGCEVLNVPVVYRSKFELQLEQSIQDIAGMTTSDNNMVFRDTSKLEDENLMSEIELEVNIKDNVRILDLLNQYNLWTQDINGKYLFKRAPNALRFCHVDLAGSGSDGQCDAAVCIGHKEWQQNNETLQKEDVYIIDLLLFITAKNKVDIHAIQQFLIDLVTERDMIIDTVTSDQWNGLVFLQGLEMSGCFREVKQLSVDAKPEPYRNAAILIEKGLVKIGNCPKLRRELEALTYVKGKVTRTVELKDGADVLCGFLYDAQLNYIDIPQYEYTKKVSTAIKNTTYTDLLDEKESLYNLF